jgi:hypothetical protein
VLLARARITVPEFDDPQFFIRLSSVTFEGEIRGWRRNAALWCGCIKKVYDRESIYL